MGLNMSRKAILICIDGCGLDYLEEVTFFSKRGCFFEGNSMVPSVTNVNNVSILTGKYPDEHGITSNYYYDRETGKEVYMESPKFIRAKTLLERATENGLKAALLTSKDKLRTLVGRRAKISFSAEIPEKWVVKKLGNLLKFILLMLTSGSLKRLWK